MSGRQPSVSWNWSENLHGSSLPNAKERKPRPPRGQSVIKATLVGSTLRAKAGSFKSQGAVSPLSVFSDIEDGEVVEEDDLAVRLRELAKQEYAKQELAQELAEQEYAKQACMEEIDAAAAEFDVKALKASLKKAVELGIPQADYADAQRLSMNLQNLEFVQEKIDELNKRASDDMCEPLALSNLLEQFERLGSMLKHDEMDAEASMPGKKQKKKNIEASSKAKKGSSRPLSASKLAKSQPSNEETGKEARDITVLRAIYSRARQTLVREQDRAEAKQVDRVVTEDKESDSEDREPLPMQRVHSKKLLSAFRAVRKATSQVISGKNLLVRAFAQAPRLSEHRLSAISDLRPRESESDIYTHVARQLHRRGDASLSKELTMARKAAKEVDEVRSRCKEMIPMLSDLPGNLENVSSRAELDPARACLKKARLLAIAMQGAASTLLRHLKSAGVESSIPMCTYCHVMSWELAPTDHTVPCVQCNTPIGGADGVFVWVCIECYDDFHFCGECGSQVAAEGHLAKLERLSPVAGWKQALVLAADAMQAGEDRVAALERRGEADLEVSRNEVQRREEEESQEEESSDGDDVPPLGVQVNSPAPPNKPRLTQASGPKLSVLQRAIRRSMLQVGAQQRFSHMHRQQLELKRQTVVIWEGEEQGSNATGSNAEGQVSESWKQRPSRIPRGSMNSSFMSQETMPEVMSLGHMPEGFEFLEMSDIPPEFRPSILANFQDYDAGLLQVLSEPTEFDQTETSQDLEVSAQSERWCAQDQTPLPRTMLKRWSHLVTHRYIHGSGNGIPGERRRAFRPQPAEVNVDDEVQEDEPIVHPTIHPHHTPRSIEDVCLQRWDKVEVTGEHAREQAQVKRKALEAMESEAITRRLTLALRQKSMKTPELPESDTSTPQGRRAVRAAVRDTARRASRRVRQQKYGIPMVHIDRKVEQQDKKIKHASLAAWDVNLGRANRMNLTAPNSVCTTPDTMHGYTGSRSDAETSPRPPSSASFLGVIEERDPSDADDESKLALERPQSVSPIGRESPLQTTADIALNLWQPWTRTAGQFRVDLQRDLKDWAKSTRLQPFDLLERQTVAKSPGPKVQAAKGPCSRSIFNTKEWLQKAEVLREQCGDERAYPDPHEVSLHILDDIVAEELQHRKGITVFHISE